MTLIAGIVLVAIGVFVIATRQRLADVGTDAIHKATGRRLRARQVSLYAWINAVAGTGACLTGIYLIGSVIA